MGGTTAVLAGVAIGLSPAVGSGALGFPADAGTGLEQLLPSLFLCLGGGYAVLFPGVRVSSGTLHIIRDWKLYPLSGRVLWILAHVTAVTGLSVCILAATTGTAVPGLLVWLFMGPYLALTGWAAALMGTAAAVRLTDASDAHTALATPAC